MHLISVAACIFLMSSWCYSSNALLLRCVIVVLLHPHCCRLDLFHIGSCRNRPFCPSYLASGCLNLCESSVQILKHGASTSVSVAMCRSSSQSIRVSLKNGPTTHTQHIHSVLNAQHRSQRPRHAVGMCF